MPAISVIVPVYNTEKYIGRCIDSILRQSFTDFDLILVEDGSPDNCGAICDQYANKDSRIHVIHQEYRGVAAARNAGIEWSYVNSDSKWITFVDSDDWIHCRYLDLLAKGLLENSVNISQCLHKQVNLDSGIEEQAEEVFEVVPVKRAYLDFYSAYFWGKLFAKKCFSKLRFPEGQIYEDVALWYKILFCEKAIVVVKTNLYYYFTRQDSIVRTEWNQKKMAQVTAWDNQLRFFRNYGDRELLDAVLVHYYQVVLYQWKSVERSRQIDEKTRKKVLCVLRHKLQKAIIWYPKSKNIPSENYSWYRTMAFPRIDRLKWLFIGAKNKLKRFFDR